MVVVVVQWLGQQAYKSEVVALLLLPSSKRSWFQSPLFVSGADGCTTKSGAGYCNSNS